jgi:hypothetical protein
MRRGRIAIAIVLGSAPVIALACGQTIDLQSHETDAGFDVQQVALDGPFIFFDGPLGPPTRDSGSGRDVDLPIGDDDDSTPPPATFVAQDGGVLGIAYDPANRNVAWIAEGGVYYCAETGCNGAVQLLTTVTGNPRSLVYASGRYFWTDDQTPGISSISETRDSFVVLNAAAAKNGRLAAGHDVVYALPDDQSSDAHLTLCGADAGACYPVDLPGVGNSVAADPGTNTAFVGFAGGDVQRVTPDGNRNDMLATGPAEPVSAIAASSDQVYWTFGSEPDIKVLFSTDMARDAGSIRFVLVTPPVRWIGVTTGDIIYWNSNGKLGLTMNGSLNPSVEDGVTVTAHAFGSKELFYANASSNQIEHRLIGK